MKGQLQKPFNIECQTKTEKRTEHQKKTEENTISFALCRYVKKSVRWKLSTTIFYVDKQKVGRRKK